MTLPFFLSFLVTFVVTVFVIKIIIKQENTVTPQVNLPIAPPLINLPNTSVAGSSQPRLFSISQSIDNNIQHNNHLEKRTPREAADNTNDPVLKESRKRELIRRDEANPHIFYRSVLHLWWWQTCNPLVISHTSFNQMFPGCQSSQPQLPLLPPAFPLPWYR